MAKCSECGFLAIWDGHNRKFWEAHKEYRENGGSDNIQGGSPSWEVPQCFIQKADLEDELPSTLSNALIGKTRRDVLEVCDRERTCDGFIPWIQGFHPKERMDMKFQEDLRAAERKHATLSLGVAVFAALVTALAGFIGAYIAYLGAQMGAEATRDSGTWQVEALREQTKAQLEMTKMQIEAQKDIAKMTPSPQIIVRMPPVPAK